MIHNHLKVKDFIPLVDKIRMKVEEWMAKLLSFAGKVELIKSVLNNYLSLWVQSFRIPNSISIELERIATNFIWMAKCMYGVRNQCAYLKEEEVWV